MQQHEIWMDALPANSYGRPSLTLTVARQIVMTDRSGWYIAPFSLGWTVGKAVLDSARDHYFHIVREDGEPVFFSTPEWALAFLQTELNVPRAPILNCLPV